MDSTVTQVRLPADLARRYDELAEETGRGREDLLVEALESYLAHRDDEDAQLHAAIAAVDQGDFVEAEVVHAEAEALIARAGVSAEHRAHIRAEVRAEMQAAYGVPLCE